VGFLEIDQSWRAPGGAGSILGMTGIGAARLLAVGLAASFAAGGQAAHAAEGPAAAGPGAAGPDLSHKVDVETAVALALERNPDIREARDLAGAASARAKAAGRLPDLGVQTQIWQQPLSTPFDFTTGGMFMFGLRQTLPAPGSLSARERAGEAAAGAAGAAATGRRADVVQQVRRAFAQYWLSEQEQLIHLEHMELTDRIVQDSRAYFQQGQMSKTDYLRTTVELARVHTILSDVAQQRRTSGALLNTLMGRPPDAPLGTPQEAALPSVEPPVADLEARLDRKPEIAAARDQVARAGAQVEGARAEASWPEFMVGLDYGYMPMDRTSSYTVMFGFTLPWLSPRRGDERRVAAAELSAAEQALVSTENQARYQLRDALARYRAARDSHDLIERELLPQTDQAARAAQESFAYSQADALGLLDALRSLLQVRLELVRARTRVEEAWADLERSAAIAAPTSAGSSQGSKP
jgi:outer membrane protein